MSESPKIICELGINHGGSLATAKQMIDVSWRAMRRGGLICDSMYWKLQKRTPELAVPEHMKGTPRKSLVTGEMTTYLQYKEEIEFWEDEYLELNEYAAQKTGYWSRLFASVWDLESVDFIESLHKKVPGGIPYIKIPSAHLTNWRLIDAAAKTGIPMILSTGMSTKKELYQAFHRIPSKTDLTIMSCTATYPCPEEETNLNKINTIRDLYGPWVKVGFSSHSPSPYPAIYSNFFGVDMIEVHFTLDRAMEGSDHSASLESRAIELLARETVRIPKLYGHGKIEPYESEMSKRKSLRGD